MVRKFIVRRWNSQLFSHADQRTREHINFRMASRIEILERRVARRRRNRTSASRGDIRLADINSLCLRNRHQFCAESVADRLHMHTVAVAADPGTENSLRQVIADIQPEFAPYFL